MNIVFIIFLLVTVLFIWWRFWFFMRNPDRKPPAGTGLLAPADGYVVYVKRVESGSVPMAVKKRTAIELTEITAMPHLKTASGYLIGTFMTAFSVHHNRVPLSGTVVFKHETRSRNNQTTARLMTNILLNRAPLEQNSTHIIENDRITTGIQSRAGVYSITQIADKWISHIINQVEPGGYLNRGERFGMIRFGSQVDVFIPDELGYTPVVQPGDYVYAGTTILASQTSDAAPNSLIINRHNTE